MQHQENPEPGFLILSLLVLQGCTLCVHPISFRGFEKIKLHWR
jgi:hypothetical protein